MVRAYEGDKYDLTMKKKKNMMVIFLSLKIYVERKKRKILNNNRS